jgi:hypothetical protein
MKKKYISPLYKSDIKSSMACWLADTATLALDKTLLFPAATEIADASDPSDTLEDNSDI